MSEIGEYQAVKVHVIKDDTKEPEKEPRREEYRVSHRTIVLTAANPAQMIAGYDPKRDSLHITVADNPVVITSSTGQANDIANLTIGLAAPNGRYVPIENPEIIVPGPDEVWVSGPTYPTRVGFTIVRCI